MGRITDAPVSGVKITVEEDVYIRDKYGVRRRALIKGDVVLLSHFNSVMKEAGMVKRAEGLMETKVLVEDAPEEPKEAEEEVQEEPEALPEEAPAEAEAEAEEDSAPSRSRKSAKRKSARASKEDSDE